MAQIGTIRLQTQNNGTVSVPVFDTGDSGSSVYEFVRVQTAGGTGFIPLVDPADASFPYLRVQSQNQGVVAVHNESSLLNTITVDGFEDNDISEYSTYNGSHTTQNSTVLTGNYSLSIDSQSGGYSTCFSVSGLDTYPAKDQAWAVKFRPPNSGNRSSYTMEFGWGSTDIAQEPGNGLCVYIDRDNNTVSEGFGICEGSTNNGTVITADNNFSPEFGQRYRVDIYWKSDGSVEAWLVDDTNDNQLSNVSSASSAGTDNEGIWWATGHNGSNWYYDNGTPTKI